ncbi:hypothetical protein QJQ45_017712, partial [Haematococcus lacustris]
RRQLPRGVTVSLLRDPAYPGALAKSPTPRHSSRWTSTSIMTSALKTTALLVLGAAISAKFANGRVLLQEPSNQATPAAIFAPLPDPSANTTGSEPTSQATVARIVAFLQDEPANTTTINATARDSDLTLDTYISEPFSTVRSCVPFTVLIAAPTKELADGMLACAARHTAAAQQARKMMVPRCLQAMGPWMLKPTRMSSTTLMRMSVSRDVLTLSISDGFETSRFKTNNIIKVTITPSSRNQISGVANSGIGNLVVGPGFLARMFTVSSKGSGNTYVFGLNTQKARVVSMGATTVLLNGNVSDGGSLEVEGTSKVYLTGAIGGTLAVNLDYQSTTYVEGTS